MKHCILCLLVCSFIISCTKKGGDTPPVSKTKTQLLTQKEWILTTSQSRKSSDATWTDLLAGKAACVLDDKFVFKADGMYQQTDGATKCNASDPFIIFTSSWAFAQNETQIVIGGGVPLTITILDETTLTTTSTKIVGGVTYLYSDTYTH